MNTISVYLYDKAVPEVNFTTEDVITTDFIDGFFTNNFWFLSVPNKISDKMYSVLTDA